MPGIIPARRKRATQIDDEDDQVSAAESNSSFVSEGSKRQRLSNGDGEGPEGDVLPDSYRAVPRHSMNGLANGISHGDNEKHAPGSIVRVKMTNFVTYTSAEYHLGPSLNMIIGPNGTGKSTLVCAICLGLGWGPQHLGRAKELGEFVKHGNKEGEIEIELAAGPKQKGKNPIVRRVITKEGNKSKWFLNGNSCPAKDVHQLARSFSIQIDNLCQFLPQDRVVEFAQLTPVQLLESTQKAAAEPEMVAWHQELKKLRADQKGKQSEYDTAKENLDSLQKRQEQQRDDVDRMQQRKKLQ
ncbi:hypothetical protein LTS18_012908, partial [Coniosporium uncinatum]